MGRQGGATPTTMEATEKDRIRSTETNMKLVITRSRDLTVVMDYQTPGDSSKSMPWVLLHPLTTPSGIWQTMLILQVGS